MTAAALLDVAAAAGHSEAVRAVLEEEGAACLGSRGDGGGGGTEVTVLPSVAMTRPTPTAPELVVARGAKPTHKPEPCATH